MLEQLGLVVYHASQTLLGYSERTEVLPWVVRCQKTSWDGARMQKFDACLVQSGMNCNAMHEGMHCMAWHGACA